MATKLKKLKIRKVDFVDQGANPDAHIGMAKRKDSSGIGGDAANLVQDSAGSLSAMQGSVDEFCSAVKNSIRQ